MGVTEDRRVLILFTVDAAGGSRGMTVSEMADVLHDEFHVYNGLNLDGGGSTTLAMADPVTGEGRVVNAASADARQRAVGSNLAVFAAPAEATRPTTRAAE
jgi:exopolysaccharide biosynthesis protein